MILEGFSPMNKDVFPQLFTAGWQPLDTAVRTRAQWSSQDRVVDGDCGQTGAWGEVSAKTGQDSTRVTAQRLNLRACSPL